MSRVCDVCGKGKMDGKTVSHANNKAPRKYNVNLQSAEIDGKKVKACTKCIRTSKKAQFWLDTWNKKDLQFASLFFVNQSAVGRRFAARRAAFRREREKVKVFEHIFRGKIALKSARISTPTFAPVSTFKHLFFNKHGRRLPHAAELQKASKKICIFQASRPPHHNINFHITLTAFCNKKANHLICFSRRLI